MNKVTPTTYNLTSQVKQLATAAAGILTNPSSQTWGVLVPNLIKFAGGILYAIGKHLDARKQVMEAKKLYLISDTESNDKYV